MHRKEITYRQQIIYIIYHILEITKSTKYPYSWYQHFFIWNSRLSNGTFAHHILTLTMMYSNWIRNNITSRYVCCYCCCWFRARKYADGLSSDSRSGWRRCCSRMIVVDRCGWSPVVSNVTTGIWIISSIFREEDDTELCS